MVDVRVRAGLTVRAKALLQRRRRGRRTQPGVAVHVRRANPGLADDACFATAYVGWIPGLILLALLPVAWFSVQLMRWWSQILTLSQRPQYQRAQRAADDKVPT